MSEVLYELHWSTKIPIVVFVVFFLAANSLEFLVVRLVVT
jgi:hypothetical protein